MGRTLASMIEQESDFTQSEMLATSDVAIDFSSAAALPALLQGCLAAQKPLVVGTTGYSAPEQKLLQEASQQIPLFVAPNFSFGMALFQEVVQALSRKAGPDVSIEIVEAHHRLKKDRPSGTALALAQSIERPSIPIHSIRAGDIFGDHTVIFAFQGERIELKHQVHSRDSFAKGALRAARFLKAKPPGFYSMKELLYAAC